MFLLFDFCVSLCCFVLCRRLKRTECPLQLDRLFTSFSEAKVEAIASRRRQKRTVKNVCGLKTNSNKYLCLGKTDVLCLLTAVDQQRINSVDCC